MCWRVYPVSVGIAILIIFVLVASTASAALAIAFPLRPIAGRALAIGINAFLSPLGDGAIGCQVAIFEGRMINGITEGTECGVHHRQCIAEDFHRAVARDGVDVFPNQFAVGSHLEEMALRVGADEGVAVWQPLAAGTYVTEESVAVDGAIAPDDLLRNLARLVVGVVVVGLTPVAGRGRVDILAGVASGGVEERINFQNR